MFHCSPLFSASCLRATQAMRAVVFCLAVTIGAERAALAAQSSDEPATPPASQAATSAEPSAKSAAAPKWKELFDGKALGNWKSTDFGGEGEVSVEDGMIVMDFGNDLTGVTYTGVLPEDNYELQLEAMRLDGVDFFATTTVPIGKEFCSLVVGGWGGTVVGISCVDGYDASENPTTQFMSFKDKQWYKIRIRVSEPRIEAWIDGERVVSQERKDHKLDVRLEVEPSQPLGVAAWRTKAAVRNIKLRPLSADEIQLEKQRKPEND